MPDGASMPNAPTRVRRAATATLWIVYLLFWTGGVASYLWLGGPPKGSEWAAPAFLWIGGLLMATQYDFQTAWRLAVAGVAGWASEWIGVHTGYPFGRYHYTDALGPDISGAPLAMIPAWILLAGYARGVVSGLGLSNRWTAALLGAGWMTAVDLIIDPLAAGPLAYWAWAKPGLYFGIPATNFAGWLLISAMLMGFIGTGPSPRGARWTGASIVGFFSVIALGAKGYAAVAALGVALLAIQWSAGRIKELAVKPTEPFTAGP